LSGHLCRTSITALLVSSLVAATLTAVAGPAAAEPARRTTPESQPRTEILAAIAKSRTTGKPAPLPFRTTESSTTAVTPGGQYVTEVATGPVRVRQSDGTWRDIDTDLVESDGALRPKVAKADVRFSAGGKGPFATMNRESGGSLSLHWPAELPRPRIEGGQAVYPGVAGTTGDLVVTALPAGFRFDLVLRARPTTPVEAKILVTASGLTVHKDGDRLRITDSDERLWAASSKPAMWDAAAKTVGTASGKGTGAIAASVEDTAQGKLLVLKPDARFLADPATAYPVTIDPTVTLPLNSDTDVNNVFDGNNVSGPYLKAGTEASGEKGRVYLKFDTRGLKPPTSASLSLSNLDAPACGPNVGTGIQVRRITSSWDANSQTWAPQPSNATDDAVLSREGSQLGVCGTGKMTWDVTAIVAKWAGGIGNYGLVLRSPTEAAESNHRVFASAENPDGLAPPTLTVTSDIPFTPGEGDDPAAPTPTQALPGRVDTDTGVWITGGTDVVEDALVTVRSHSAGQRIDNTQPNEEVLGPDWRLEPLGGMLGDRFQDYSANGYVQVKHTIGTESTRFPVSASDPDTFVASDGTTVRRNADGTFTQDQSATTGFVYRWARVGGEFLITRLGKGDTGTTLIDYDAQGRVSRLSAPATPQETCAVPGGTGCSALTFQYAQSTTATAAQFGDVAGQLKEIVYDAAGAVGPAVIVRYLYDVSRRLREVKNVRQIDGGPIETSAYTYDTAGNITRLDTPDEGGWTLVYEDLAKLASATQVTPPTSVAGLVANPPAPPGNCPFANQYMTGTPRRCWAGPVPMEYGGRTYPPRDMTTRTGRRVVGVDFDHCTAPANRPFWNDFTIPCDSHDYGYGIIYLRTLSWDKSKKRAVDAVFYSLMRDNTCPSYSWWRRPSCRYWAYVYYTAVYWGGGRSMKYRHEY
jgi:hypothetical protein